MRLSLVFVLSALGLCAQGQGRVEEYFAGQLVVQAPAATATPATTAAPADGGAAGAQEQARLEEQTAKSAAKLEELKRSLARATRSPGGITVRGGSPKTPAQRLCSIPLLQVGPQPDFRSNMPIIEPGDIDKAMTVAPKAPVCGEQTNK